MIDKETTDKLWNIKGCALEVHKQLGCGFLEKVYQLALAKELTKYNIPHEREKHLDIYYKGELLEDAEYIADFVCYGDVIVELNAVKEINEVHIAQVINYLKAISSKVGLLINFGERSLKTERIINFNLINKK